MLDAASVCVAGGGMSDLHIDTAGALAMARAMGVDDEIAATLLTACAEGVRAGLAKRREKQ